MVYFPSFFHSLLIIAVTRTPGSHSRLFIPPSAFCSCLALLSREGFRLFFPRRLFIAPNSVNYIDVLIVYINKKTSVYGMGRGIAADTRGREPHDPPLLPPPLHPLHYGSCPFYRGNASALPSFVISRLITLLPVLTAAAVLIARTNEYLVDSIEISK